MATAKFTTRSVPIEKLKPHPRNYQGHPPEEIVHLKASLTEFDFYRNVVVANDNTILAGHGVVAAARELGLDAVPVRVMPFGPDDPRALKLLAADNEIGNLADRDDRMLTEMLKEIADLDVGLLGTGYDEQQLANLLFVSRSAAEIETMDEAAAWVGMPEFEAYTHEPQLMVRFENEADREKFVAQFALDGSLTRGKRVWSAWWPPRVERGDPSHALFDDAAEAPVDA